MPAERPTPLLTLAGGARRCDTTAVRLSRFMRAGGIAADYKAGSVFLFTPERAEEIRVRLNCPTDTVQS